MNTVGITFLIQRLEKQQRKYFENSGTTSKMYFNRLDKKIKELKQIKKEWEL